MAAARVRCNRLGSHELQQRPLRAACSVGLTCCPLGPPPSPPPPAPVLSGARSRACPCPCPRWCTCGSAPWPWRCRACWMGWRRWGRALRNAPQRSAPVFCQEASLPVPYAVPGVVLLLIAAPTCSNWEQRVVHFSSILAGEARCLVDGSNLPAQARWACASAGAEPDLLPGTHAALASYAHQQKRIKHSAMALVTFTPSSPPAPAAPAGAQVHPRGPHQHVVRCGDARAKGWCWGGRGGVGRGGAACC